jgi:hypothetical protein
MMTKIVGNLQPKWIVIVAWGEDATGSSASDARAANGNSRELELRTVSRPPGAAHQLSPNGRASTSKLQALGSCRVN